MAEDPKRYYRSESGTTAGSGTTALGAVLPLGSFGGTTDVDRDTTAGVGQGRDKKGKVATSMREGRHWV